MIPAFVLAGVGMGFFFAPIARLTIDFAPTALQGVASGTSNALRQLGTVLGIAVLGAIFSAVGGYTSGQSFVNGMRAAEIIGASILGVGTVLALLIPAHRPERALQVNSTELATPLASTPTVSSEAVSSEATSLARA